MKRLFLLSLAGLFMFLTATKTFAEKFHGEFCWQVFNEFGDPYWRYKFGVYEKEGGHFVLYGSVDYGDNGISASHGNAIFVGDNIKLTIVSTDYEEGVEVWSETFAAKLNNATLSGSWNVLSLEIGEGENLVRPVHHRGTINLIACP